MATDFGHHPTPIRLVVVDPHPMVRRQVTSMMARTADIAVVGEATNVDAATGVSLRIEPDVVVTDSVLPDGSGFDLCLRLAGFDGAPHCIVHARSVDDDDRRRARSLQAQLLLKSLHGEPLLAAVRRSPRWRDHA